MASKLLIFVATVLLVLPACKQSEAAGISTQQNSNVSSNSNPTPTPPVIERPPARELAKETGGITKRIEFVRGKNSAVIKDTVAIGTTNVYLISAKANQTLVVNLKSMKKPGFPNSETDAIFGITNSQNNKPLEGAEGFDWSGKLPETGEYVIDISGGRGNTDYVLKVLIK